MSGYHTVIPVSRRISPLIVFVMGFVPGGNAVPGIGLARAAEREGRSDARIPEKYQRKIVGASDHARCAS